MDTAEVKQIKPEEWDTMSFDQQMAQKTILLDRYEYMLARGYTEQSRVIYEGIQKLDSLMFG
jgi:hypothetical protein